MSALRSLAAALAGAALLSACWNSTNGAPATAPPASSATATAAPPAAPRAVLALLAGDGHVGSDDGAAARARFADPYGIAVGADGTLYVADGGANNSIRRLSIGPDGQGQVSTWAGGAGEGLRDGSGAAAAFHTPSALAFDAASGDLYVADTGNHAIRRIAPDGRVTTLAGNGEAGFRDGQGAAARFDGPVGIAVDAHGRVIVADTYNDRIRAIDRDGRVTTLAGGGAARVADAAKRKGRPGDGAVGPGFADGPGTEARFDTPSAVAIDAQGRIVVADTRNNAIRRLEPDGTVTTLLRTDPRDRESLLRRPISLAFAPDGALHVGQLAEGLVLRLPPGGGAVEPLTDDRERRLARPTALAFDRAGRLLIADAASQRLHRLETTTAPEVRDGPLGPAPDAALPATAQRWPLRPQLGWHEVVGTIGEVRGDGQGAKGEARDHLHAGLDVRGDVGAPVLAIADAKVASPVAAGGFGRLGEGLFVDQLGYVHMKVGRRADGKPLDAKRFQIWRGAKTGKPELVRVRRGTRFAAGDALGTINAMAHVHLMLGVPGYVRDPLELGFKDFVDTKAPRIDAIELLDAGGRVLPGLAAGAGDVVAVPRATTALEVVVDAWDQVDGNLPRRRLGLRALGHQLLRADGTPVPGFERPRWSLDFERLPPDDAATRIAYADSSGIKVHGAAATSFRYRLAAQIRDGRATDGLLDLASLVPGDYRLRVFGRDAAGNQAVGVREVMLRLQ